MLMEHGPEVDLVVKVSTFRCHIGLLLYEYKIMQSSWHTKVSHYVQKHIVSIPLTKGWNVLQPCLFTTAGVCKYNWPTLA